MLRTKKRIQPVINTNALPDIIFMLLFFFMVVTVMRKNPMLLKIKIPTASESSKLENRSLVNHIYIGPPLNPQHTVKNAIQIQDAFVSENNLQQAIRKVIANKAARTEVFLSTALKVDENVEMGIVNDVKMALRKEGQLQLSYLATRPLLAE
ncbi:MAG: ExbD/TolR family protein [Saprospiraceae bacterium]